jgi:hypothetical protein
MAEVLSSNLSGPIVFIDFNNLLKPSFPGHVRVLYKPLEDGTVYARGFPAGIHSLAGLRT